MQITLIDYYPDHLDINIKLNHRTTDPTLTHSTLTYNDQDMALLTHNLHYLFYTHNWEALQKIPLLRESTRAISQTHLRNCTRERVKWETIGLARYILDYGIWRHNQLTTPQKTHHRIQILHFRGGRNKTTFFDYPLPPDELNEEDEDDE